MKVEIRGGSTLPGTVRTPGYKDWIAIGSLTMRMSRVGDESRSGKAEAEEDNESFRRAETLQNVISALSPSASAVGGKGPQVQLATVEQLRKVGSSNWKRANLRRGAALGPSALSTGRVLRAAALDEIRITKTLDRSSPGLLRWSSREASPIESVQRAQCDVTVCVLRPETGNGPAEWTLKYLFSDCIPESYAIVHGSGEDLPIETVYLRTAKVTIEYRDFAPDGTLEKGRDAACEYAPDATDP